MKKYNTKENRDGKNEWQIQEAKAKFSRLVEDANMKGHQTITKQGRPVAVILSKEEFDRMSQPRASFLNFFRAAPCQEIDLNIQRSKDVSREFDI